MDESLWNVDNYEEFLRKRIEIIARAIESELNIKVLKGEA